MTDDKERLLAVLVNSTRPMRVLVLTKAVGIEKKQLNKLLYCLQERGMVERTSETPPLWMATVAAVNGEYSTDETTLISLLTERGQHGMSTSTIASFLRKSVAVVNKMLYGLERESEVHRLSICPPVWKATCNRASTSEGASYNSSSGSEGTSSDSADTLVADIKKRPAKTAFSEESEANQSATKRYENTCVSKADGKRLRMSSPANSQSTSTVQVATADQQKDARSTPHSLSKVAPLTTSDSEKVHHDADASKKQASWARQCSDAIWTKYRQLNTNAKDNDILAGFILREDHGSQKTARVVAIGSGTKCAVGNNFSLAGCVVHDSHAEIVARRSLIRWLYAQLAKAGSEGSLCSRCSDRSTPYVFHKVQLWFYVSQAPCGDCAIFSRSDPRPESVPCWTSKKQGKLRLKVEAGQGTFIPGSGEKQTTDGLMKGDRAKNHSCSDKMAKWSVLGVQGALLSRLMPPLYISGVVVSEVFSYGHICRGLCCRSERALHDAQATLPTPFEVAHPQIVHAPISITRAAQIKKHGNESHNWMELDSAIETVDGTTGRRVENRSESRICKRHLLASFCGLSEGPSAVSRSYSENKLLAVSYQEAKQIWIDAMATSYGFWQSKPSEFDEFSISFNSPAPTV